MVLVEVLWRWLSSKGAQYGRFDTHRSAACLYLVFCYTDFGVEWCGLIDDCCCVVYATFGRLFGD